MAQASNSASFAADLSVEVLVVGAGAAGLLAAARSAERGRRTLLVEKSRKPGVKILMSGGTRCNLAHDCDAVGIIAAFGSAGSFLHSPLAALGPRELVELFRDDGLATKVEPGGKIFPQSDRALDVLNALLGRLERCGAELSLDEAVTDVERVGAVVPGAHGETDARLRKADRHDRRQELPRLRNDRRRLRLVCGDGAYDSPTKAGACAADE